MVDDSELARPQLPEWASGENTLLSLCFSFLRCLYVEFVWDLHVRGYCGIFQYTCCREVLWCVCLAALLLLFCVFSCMS